MSQNNLSSIQTPILTVFILLVTVLMSALHGTERDIRDSRPLQVSVLIIVLEMIFSTYYALQFLSAFLKYLFVGLLLSVLGYLIGESVSEPEKQLYRYGWLILRGIRRVIVGGLSVLLSTLLWLIPETLKRSWMEEMLRPRMEEMLVLTQEEDKDLTIMVSIMFLSFGIFILGLLSQLVNTIIHLNQGVSYSSLIFSLLGLIFFTIAAVLGHIQISSPNMMRLKTSISTIVNNVRNVKLSSQNLAPISIELYIYILIFLICFLRLSTFFAVNPSCLRKRAARVHRT